VAADWSADSTLDHRGQTLDTPAGPSQSAATNTCGLINIPSFIKKRGALIHHVNLSKVSLRMPLKFRKKAAEVSVHISKILYLSTSCVPSHHVGVGSAGHALARVEVEEFIDLWWGQSVPNLQLLDDEHLSGERQLAAGTDPDHSRYRSLPFLPRCGHCIWLVLEGHLQDRQWETCWGRGAAL